MRNRPTDAAALPVRAQATVGGPAFARAVVVGDAAAVVSDKTAIVVELSGAPRVRISATAPVEL